MRSSISAGERPPPAAPVRIAAVVTRHAAKVSTARPVRPFRLLGSRPWRRVVLPGDRAPGQLRHRVVGQPGEMGEAALNPPVAAGGPDHVELLLEPDRDARPQAQDQAIGDPRLELRERLRARVVDAAQRPPAPGEFRFRSTPCAFPPLSAARLSGLRTGTIQRSTPRGELRSSRCAMTIPAGSLPWIRPTTST
jgi:hypothetical protein